MTKFFGEEPPLLGLFLEKLGYERYLRQFEEEKIGMVELPYISEDRLQRLGIPMGPRMRILQEAQGKFVFLREKMSLEDSLDFLRRMLDMDFAALWHGIDFFSNLGGNLRRSHAPFGITWKPHVQKRIQYHRNERSDDERCAVRPGAELQLLFRLTFVKKKKKK